MVLATTPVTAPGAAASAPGGAPAAGRTLGASWEPWHWLHQGRHLDQTVPGVVTDDGTIVIQWGDEAKDELDVVVRQPATSRGRRHNGSGTSSTTGVRTSW